MKYDCYLYLFKSTVNLFALIQYLRRKYTHTIRIQTSGIKYLIQINIRIEGIIIEIALLKNTHKSMFPAVTEIFLITKE